ncbi:HlyC/CorC family transporter [Clostridium sp. YIM B02505]|uniref:HlyC/CorC family transporter n=1 Tax=Clostridium yunnanense TaxID=2800325 RepID=A0ABS1EMG5_9CLOT|nr:hemolysin family protein [Clostridium yunnanense]MBK1810571.1 HlyC/CorC family transporter [Clostridium yunnanense]
MEKNLITSILLVIVLIAINAFLVAAEMSIVSLNKNRIGILADKGDKKAILLKNLTNEPSRFLATIQVGITLAGFFASASAATSLSNSFARFLSKNNVPYSDQIALVIITVVISYFTLVLGELFPKRLALKKSESVAMFTVKPIVMISKVTVPFVKFLSFSTNLLIRLFGIDMSNMEERVSEEEIKSMIEVGKEHGVINETEREMINGIFRFDDKLAKEVMIPRTEVFMLDGDEKIADVIEEIVNEKFSRIPIYEEEVDNIIGILYTKDIFSQFISKDIEDIELNKLVREPYFVPETKHIDELFKDIKETKSHMAILIDEYGGFSGIVTLEDLVEEVMGNISDEYDEDEQEIRKIDEHTYSVDGLLSIYRVNEILNLNISSEDTDTIGGFVLEMLGTIPKSTENSVVNYDNITLKIEEMSVKRVERVRIFIQ